MPVFLWIQVFIGALTLVIFSKFAVADEIKIGFLPPLAGPSAAVGLSETRAINLATKQINAAGGVNGSMIKLITVDSQALPKLAAEAVQTLVEKDKVVAIVGPILSSQIVAMIPGIKKYEVPVLMGATAPRLAVEGNRWLFRMRPGDDVVAMAMVKFLKEDLKIKKAAILHDESPFGVGGSIAIQDNAKVYGIEIVKRVQLVKGETDIGRYLKEIKEAGAEVLIAYSPTTEGAGSILRQWGEAGRPFRLIGSATFSNKMAHSAAGSLGEGAYAVVDAVLVHAKEGQKFQGDFRAEYNADIDALYVFPFDAMKILARALAKGKSLSGKKLRDAIAEVNDYDGTYGPIRFDSHGNGCHEVSVVKMTNQQPVFIKTIKAN